MTFITFDMLQAIVPETFSDHQCLLSARIALSDSEYITLGMLTYHLNDAVADGTLQQGCVIKITDYTMVPLPQRAYAKMAIFLIPPISDARVLHFALQC